ncbi:MAG: glycosyltransferase family 2 protein [Gemmatimonadota bacterium]
MNAHRRVSVVMPVYNERATVEEIVRRVRAVPLEIELVVVDDGSTDGSREVLENLAEAGSIDRLILHDVNRGKGAALSTGFGAASGDAVLVQDADLEYDPQEYPLLLSPIWENKADVVYGSRFTSGRPHRVLYFWHYVGNRLLTLVSNMVTNLNLSDMETCYKCFRREVLQGLEIEEKAFGVEPEITAKVALQNWRVYEVGISYSGRTYAEGKKIGWRDGMRAIYCIWRYGLWRRITGRAKRRSGPHESGA